MRSMVRRLTLAATIFIVGWTPTVGGQGGSDNANARPSPNAIVGRIVDASGKPVAGTFVTALWPNADRKYGFEPVSGRRRAEADERGEFVLDNLVAGEYYVIAVPRNAAVDSAGRPNLSGFGNTFYPSAARVSEATLVRVTPMGRVTANITLVPARLSTVSGQVVASSGGPVRGGPLVVARGDGLFGMFTGTTTIASNGVFVISGLQPGTYYFHYREGQWPPPRGAVPMISGATVTVAGDNVTNLRVSPIPMVRGAGRVTVTPTSTGLDLATVTVGGSPVDFNGNPGPQLPGAIQSNLTFEFKTWPSVGRVRVDGLPRGWRIDRVTLNRVDITDAPIEFIAGKDVTGIEIALRGPEPPR
jgi:hypothetical protein